MKKILVLSLMLGMALTSCKTTGSNNMKTDRDSVAYAIGALEFGPNVAYLDSVQNFDASFIIGAIQDAVNNKSKMTREEANAFLMEYFNVRLPQKNLKESEEFLAGVEKQANVQKTASGLLYEIIEAGGEKATNDADTVVVLYKGTLQDGTVFDSTEDRGNQSISFPLNGVIPAWSEGMKLVGKGGKIKLYAHPDLAYGAQGQGSIEPNKALVFEVELVDVKPVAVEE